MSHGHHHQHAHPHPHGRHAHEPARPAARPPETPTDEPNPRREFLKRGAALLSAALAPATGARAQDRAADKSAAGGVAGSAAASGQTPQPDRPSAETEPMEVFDAHLHCPTEAGKVWQWYTVTPTFADFASYLDRCGVHSGIINSLRSQEARTPAEFIAGNREVARFVEKYKGRFIGACVVNPMFIDEALREIEDCRKQLGFVWVGELCNYVTGWQYTTRQFEQLVGQVEKMNMVLDVHTELDEMEYIIRQFPRATIVFPHFGDSHEGRDIFKRIDLVARNPNCYLDTSGYGHDRVGMLEYSVKTIGPERVLFGSDFSINDPSTVIARVKNAFISDADRRRILSANLKQLLASKRKS